MGLCFLGHEHVRKNVLHGNYLRKSIVFDYAYAGVFWKIEMQETLQLNKYLRLMAYFR